MGRQAYLTRVALGRSAFQSPVEPHLPETNSESHHETAQHSTDSDYVQKYDSKGYAINTASIDLKRRMTHAQNDVLATVGVCAKVDSSTGSRKSRSAMDKSRVEIVKNENESGLLVSTVDVTVMTLIEPWAVGLRQRLQAFRFLSGVPLTTIVKSDWRVWHPMKFFFAGAPASWAFYALENGKTEAAMILYYYGYVGLLECLKKPGEPKKLSGPMSRLLLKLKLASFILLTPLEIHATLQRLGIAPTWAILPHPTSYRSILGGLFLVPNLPQPLNWTMALEYIRSVAVIPLLVFAAISYAKPAVTLTLYKYLRAALPKPTHPDKYSLQGAHEDELDGGTIPGLIDEDETEDREVTSVIDILAKDLQAIGRNWQILQDRCSDFVTRNVNWLSHRTRPTNELSNSPSSSPSTVLALPCDLTEAMESMPETIENDDSPPQSQESLDGMRTEFQRLVDAVLGTTTDNDRSTRRGHTDFSPRASPLRLPSSDPNFPTFPQDQSPYTVVEPTSSRRRDSSSSSIVLWPLSTPSPPIQMNDMIPADMAVRTSNFSQGFQAPLASSTDSDSSNSHEEEPRPYHRVTALTAHAAEAMAQHLSYQFADLLFLPLDALFVRSVAMTFWSAPGLSTTTRGAAGRWKGDVYPLGSWFGMGLRAGGWRGICDYAGKMLLVWVMQVGMGFAVWELSTGLMWWAGLRWYDWLNL
ncbi:MAG: hypothetical protein Q9217_001764 [Psora testacea]